MQFKYSVLASALASVAYSQTIAGEIALIPSCALTCLTTAISGAGCGIADYACQCGTQRAAITKVATPCVAGACNAADALTVNSVTNEICVLVAAESSSAPAAAPTTSSAPAAVVSTTPAGTTTAAAGTTSSAAAAGTTSSAAPSVASTSSTAAAPSAAKSTSSSAPVAQVTGNAAAGRLQAAGALVGAAALMAFNL